MNVFYLVVAVLMQTGETPPTISYPFHTEAECKAAGVEASAQLVADPTIKEAKWRCDPASFDYEPKHVPGKNEA